MFCVIIWILCLKRDKKLIDFSHEINFPNFEGKTGIKIAQSLSTKASQVIGSLPSETLLLFVCVCVCGCGWRGDNYKR